MGSLRGKIFKYLIDNTKLRSGSFTLIDADVLKFHVGFKATAAVADLNNDGKTDYISGNSRGGLMFFSEALLDTSVLLSVNQTENINNKINFDVYPNPASSQITIRLNQSGNEELKSVALYDLLGRNFNVQIQQLGNNQFWVSTSSVPDGFYLLVLNNNFNSSKKIVVSHSGN